MQQTDAAIKEYMALKADGFELVGRLTIQQKESWTDTYSSTYALVLEIWLSQYSSEEPHTQLCLQFENVQELIINSRSQPLTLHLNIHTHYYDQWEILRYTVEDQEQKISFHSQGFSVYKK